MADNEIALAFQAVVNAKLGIGYGGKMAIDDFTGAQVLDAAIEAVEGFRKTPATNEQPRYDARLNDDGWWFVWDRIATRQVGDAYDNQGDALAVTASLNAEAAAQAPAASEQPRCAHVDVRGFRCLEPRTDRHVHVYDRASQDALHAADRPAASGDTIEQAARTLAKSDEEWLKQRGVHEFMAWDGLSEASREQYRSDARRLAASGLLATNQAHDEPAGKRFTDWMAERLANYAAKWGDDRARIEKALALHANDDGYCTECGVDVQENQIPWPCLTVAALTDTEETNRG